MLETKKSPTTAQTVRGSENYISQNYSPYSSSQKELSLDDARCMLQSIPADERELWLKVGMALSSEYGDRGFPVWDEWSQTADNYRPLDSQRAWSSFRGDGVGIGSLIFYAKQHGWRSGGSYQPLPPLRPSKPLPKTKSTKAYAFKLWLAASTDDRSVGGHPYAKNKGIEWAGGAARGCASGKLIGANSDCLIIPIYEIESEKLQGVQCINPSGDKQTFGAVSGGCLLLGNTLSKSVPWFVAEGWASAVSMVFHHCKGHAVCAVSFGKSQLEQVANSLASTYQPEEITILQEVDA